MSYANINGAQIYYDTYGADPPDRPRIPVLLIHGAGNTGQADWREVAPLLARHYRVVVPDCRGHGRSTNPGWSYHFREIADDLAVLIRRLGYARAHIVGSGNGGNVALVMLLERADLVQTCTLQAANAFVSADMLENQGALDTERMAFEAPDRVREMITLHAPMHGREYWRDLWSLTLAETFSEPTYAADDLALAARPVLVIQGEQDRINVPGRHGQFLGRYIPDAETWFPTGAGHDVHRELPWPWTDQVLDFLRRRGDEANEALDRLRRGRYRDGRETVFAVRAEFISPDNVSPDGPFTAGFAPELDGDQPNAPCETNGCVEGLRVYLTGQVLVSQQCEAAITAVAELRQIAGTAAGPMVEDKIRVLMDGATPRALVHCPLVDLRSAPDERAGRVSQALIGESVRVLEERDGWTRVQLEADGCLGWLQSATLQPLTGNHMAGHTATDLALVVAQSAAGYVKPSRNSHHVGRLPFGAALPMTARRGQWAALGLPGGVEWWVPACDLIALAERPQPDRVGAARVLRWLRRWVGVPYLEGGRTAFGVDSAGLAQAFLRLLGLSAPRYADQQFMAGRAVSVRPQLGDLVFFAHEPADEDGEQLRMAHRISHVAISLGGYRLLQAGGGALSVNIINLNRPHGPAAIWLRAHMAGARRFTCD
jgi:pimeloyl-ACP methyl ester carboxylesterase